MKTMFLITLASLLFIPLILENSADACQPNQNILLFPCKGESSGGLEFQEGNKSYLIFAEKLSSESPVVIDFGPTKLLSEAKNDILFLDQKSNVTRFSYDESVMFSPISPLKQFNSGIPFSEIKCNVEPPSFTKDGNGVIGYGREITHEDLLQGSQFYIDSFEKAFPEYPEIPLRFAGMTLAEIKSSDYGFIVLYSEFKPLSQSIEIHIEKCDCKSLRGNHSYEKLQTIDGVVFAVYDTRSTWPDVNEKYNKHHIRFVKDGFEYEVIGKDFELLTNSIASKLLGLKNEN